MILIHESMPNEAAHVESVLRDVLGVDCAICDEHRDDLFPPISDPTWRGSDGIEVLDRLQDAFPGQPVFLLTLRDLFDFSPGKSPEDYWMFGITRSGELHCVVSVARLRGTDSNPAPIVMATDAQYKRRLATLAVHEVGHVFTKGAGHHRESTAVNVKTDAHDYLGKHCSDRTCIMYPTIDVKAPPAEIGYMEFESPTERRFDAGLDDQLIRLRTDWFCLQCRAEMRVPDGYRLSS